MSRYPCDDGRLCFLQCPQCVDRDREREQLDALARRSMPATPAPELRPAVAGVSEAEVEIAAAVLDHPSVYMGGPSERSKRLARRVLTAAAQARRAEQDAEVERLRKLYKLPAHMPLADVVDYVRGYQEETDRVLQETNAYALKLQARASKAVLRRLEWVVGPSLGFAHERCCVCHRRRTVGHDPSCPLAALLSTAPISAVMPTTRHGEAVMSEVTEREVLHPRLLSALAEVARYEGKNQLYWWRRASMGQLAELGLTEPYRPASMANGKGKTLPYRITTAGRRALAEAGKEAGRG